MEAISSNITRKLLWFEISKMLIVVKNNKLIVLFIIIFGTYTEDSLRFGRVVFKICPRIDGQKRWSQYFVVLLLGTTTVLRDDNLVYGVLSNRDRSRSEISLLRGYANIFSLQQERYHFSQSFRKDRLCSSVRENVCEKRYKSRFCILKNERNVKIRSSTNHPIYSAWVSSLLTADQHTIGY